MNCTLGQESGYSVNACRNNSMTSASRLVAFGSIAFAPMGIAIAFMWVGAWLVLPFVGIELAVLFFAFRYVERHALDYERLTISDDIVQIEAAEAGCVRKVQMGRWWAQIICRHDGARLALRSHGKEVEFGRHLTDAQRRAVAGALRKELGKR